MNGWRTAKRPGVDYFLAYLSQFYEIVIFTEQHHYVRLLSIFVPSSLLTDSRSTRPFSFGAGLFPLTDRAPHPRKIGPL